LPSTEPAIVFSSAGQVADVGVDAGGDDGGAPGLVACSTWRIDVPQGSEDNGQRAPLAARLT
jgi:hypothetical protein